MADTIKIGPPFLGMTEDPFDAEGRCTFAMNYIPRGVKLHRRLGWSNIAAFLRLFYCELGVRGFGTKRGLSTLVGMNGSSKSRVPRGEIHMASSIGYVRADVDGETPKGNYTFAALAGTLYAAAGHKVIKFDCDNLTAEELPMAVGIESASKSYLAAPPPAKAICSHLGRMWYAGFESMDIPVFGTTANDGTYTDDTSWIVSGSRVNFKPWHILYSDPYHPEQIQSLHNFAIEDNGNPVVAMAPFMGGLLVLTTANAWFLSGTDDSTWRIDLIGRSGCVNNTSLAVAPDAAYWLGPDGIYYLGTDLGLKRVQGLDWIWNGSPPMFPALYGNNTQLFSTGNITVSDTTTQLSSCGVVDIQQGCYLLSGLLRGPYNTADFGSRFDVGVRVDLTTKSTSFVFPCPRILGTSGNTDLGSTVSDILGAATGAAGAFAMLSDKYTDDMPFISSAGYQFPAYYISAFKDVGAYFRAEAIRVFTSPQDVTVSILSWERTADMTSPAGENTTVPGKGSTAPDVFSDDQTFPRWLAASATTGNKWLAASATTGERWLVETPGSVRVPVLGHGRSFAVMVYDTQAVPAPIFGLSVDVKADGV